MTDRIDINAKIYVITKVIKSFKYYYVVLDLGKVIIPLLKITYDFDWYNLGDNGPFSCVELHLEKFTEPTSIEDIINYAELLYKNGGEGPMMCSREHLKEEIERLKKLLEK